MNQTDQYPQRYDDEISLVDLATTFIRRRNVFFLVFGGVVAIALLYALLIAGEVREYTTLVQLAEEKQEDGMEPFQAPEVVLANISNRWYPELLATYAEVEGEKLPFKVNSSHPEDTALIKLTTEASPMLAEQIKNIHQQLVDQVLQRQSELFSRQKSALEQRLASVNGYLEQLSGQEAAGEAAAQAIQNRVDLEAQLESLQPAESLVIARQSIDETGTSKALILALAIVLGGMLGIFAAFMAEFIGHVRKAMKESA